MSEHHQPLSPHLQVYRWEITMLLSILHRVTGAALTAGGFLATLWLIALASGPTDYARVYHLITSWPGVFLALLFGFSLFFHLANGIRHLVWDLGYGFATRSYFRSAWLVLISAFIATAVVFWIAIKGLG